MFHTDVNSGMYRLPSVIDMFLLRTLADATPKNSILNRFLGVLDVDSLHDIIITTKRR